MAETLQECIAKARKAVSLLSDSVEALIAEWQSDDQDAADAQSSPDGARLPTHAAYNAQQTIAACTGLLQELTFDPATRLFEINLEYAESRALHIAAHHRIADLVAEQDDGVHVNDLASKTGLEKRKLVRVLRALCSAGVFRESATERFANNRISRALVGNTGLRAYLLASSNAIFAASLGLPATLAHPVRGLSYAVEQTGFTLVNESKDPFFPWMLHKKPAAEMRASLKPFYVYDETLEDVPDDQVVSNPELTNFNLAMAGGGKALAMAVLYDYPWGDLMGQTVVDVGAGVGGMGLDLIRLYHGLKYIAQDLPGVIDQAQGIWETQNPEALVSGQVKLQSVDFFQANPVKEAGAYVLRFILHDWSDEYCRSILRNVAGAMAPGSRLLIVDQIMETTLPHPATKPAPEPLPANYGAASRRKHMRDLNMMAVLNGIERSPADFDALLTSVGLKMVKIYPCRGMPGVVECRLP